MQSKRRSLIDLVNTIDWILIENKFGGGRTAINPNTVKIKLEGKNKHDTEVKRVVITIGAEIMKKLGWNYGDKVSFFHHPDDLLTFRGVRSIHGHKIGKNKGSTNGFIQLTWPHPQLGLKTCKTKECEFEVYNDQLLLVIDDK